MFRDETFGIHKVLNINIESNLLRKIVIGVIRLDLSACFEHIQNIHLCEEIENLVSFFVANFQEINQTSLIYLKLLDFEIKIIINY